MNAKEICDMMKLESDATGYLKTAFIEFRRHHVRRGLSELSWAIQDVLWSITHVHN
jgi:hypothetical protein